MKQYEVIKQDKWIVTKTTCEGAETTEEYFTGYDFMGTDNWTDSILHSGIVEYESKEEAEQIVKDLEAADPIQAPAYKTEVETQSMLDYIQELFTDWLADREKYGPDDRIVDHVFHQLIGMKTMVEILIGTPVNLQKDGKVTTGF